MAIDPLKNIPKPPPLGNSLPMGAIPTPGDALPGGMQPMAGIGNLGTAVANPYAEGFQQVQLGGGTYGGYNPSTGQAIAFSDLGSFHNYFNNFDANAQMAKFDTSKLLANPNQVLSINQVQPAQPLIRPGTTPTAPGGSPSAAGTGTTGANPDAERAAIRTYQENLADFTPPVKTETQIKEDKLRGDIAKDLEKTKGKQQALADKEVEMMIPQDKAALADLNALILARSAQYDQLYQLQENKPIPMNFIIGNQSQVKKAAASEIGLLQARALGMQGKIKSAMDTAARAIDLQYATYEDNVRVGQAQLDLLGPQLSKDDARQRAALTQMNTERLQALADLKKKQKDNMNAAFAAGVKTPFVNMGGEFFRIADGKPYSRPEDFFKDAGVTSFAEAYAKGFMTDVAAKGDTTKLPASYQEYALTTNNPTPGGYDAFLTRKQRSSSGGSKALTFAQNLTAQEQADQEGIASWLETRTAAGSYSSDFNGPLQEGAGSWVSPEDYNTAKAAWVGDGHSAADFDNIFSGYVDPKRTAEYGVKWKVAPQSGVDKLIEDITTGQVTIKRN